VHAFFSETTVAGPLCWLAGIVHGFKTPVRLQRAFRHDNARRGRDRSCLGRRAGRGLPEPPRYDERNCARRVAQGRGIRRGGHVRIHRLDRRQDCHAWPRQTECMRDIDGIAHDVGFLLQRRGDVDRRIGDDERARVDRRLLARSPTAISSKVRLRRTSRSWEEKVLVTIGACYGSTPSGMVMDEERSHTRGRMWKAGWPFL